MRWTSACVDVSRQYLTILDVSRKFKETTKTALGWSEPAPSPTIHSKTPKTEQVMRKESISQENIGPEDTMDMYRDRLGLLY